MFLLFEDSKMYSFNDIKWKNSITEANDKLSSVIPVKRKYQK